MKRTGAGVLIAAVAIGVIVGFGIDQLLTAVGRPTFTPSLLLPVLLVLLGVALVLFALPIRRAIVGTHTRPLDPFRAVRVAMLAKASSVVGAVLAGAAGYGGILISERANVRTAEAAQTSRGVCLGS